MKKLDSSKLTPEQQNTWGQSVTSKVVRLL